MSRSRRSISVTASGQDTALRLNFRLLLHGMVTLCSRCSRDNKLQWSLTHLGKPLNLLVLLQLTNSIYSKSTLLVLAPQRQHTARFFTLVNTVTSTLAGFDFNFCGAWHNATTLAVPRAHEFANLLATHPLRSILISDISSCTSAPLCH